MSARWESHSSLGQLSSHRDRHKGRRGIPSWNSPGVSPIGKAPFKPLKEAFLKHWPSRLFSSWPWVRANAGVRSMLGKTKTSDTSQTGQKCLCTQHPTSFPRTSWPRRVQTVWPQWLCQPWPQLWISPSILIGPCVRSQHCATYWDRTSDRTRS